MSEDRLLRDALEEAQARAQTLKAQRDVLEEELLLVREKLPLAAPGENRELVRLHAQVHAQQLQLTNLQAERDRLLAQLAELHEEAQREGRRAETSAESGRGARAGKGRVIPVLASSP